MRDTQHDDCHAATTSLFLRQTFTWVSLLFVVVHLGIIKSLNYLLVFQTLQKPVLPKYQIPNLAYLTNNIRSLPRKGFL